jgi:hypothetical protein
MEWYRLILFPYEFVIHLISNYIPLCHLVDDFNSKLFLIEGWNYIRDEYRDPPSPLTKFYTTLRRGPTPLRPNGKIAPKANLTIWIEGSPRRIIYMRKRK